MPLLSVFLQLGSPTSPPVAMTALAANFTGQADLDCPVLSIETVVQRQEQPKTHSVSSSDLLCSRQPFLISAFCLARYIITAMVSTLWDQISPEAACSILVVAKS